MTRTLPLPKPKPKPKPKPAPPNQTLPTSSSSTSSSNRESALAPPTLALDDEAVDAALQAALVAGEGVEAEAQQAVAVAGAEGGEEGGGAVRLRDGVRVSGLLGLWLLLVWELGVRACREGEAFGS